jgi:ribose transport system ATP-binding protein
MIKTDELLFEVKNLSKEFPGVKALDDVSLEIKKGEVHALCGENGAGKSTLIKILAGIYSKDAGTLCFDGREVDITTAHQSLDLGIKVVFQELALLPEMSVSENVFLESFPQKKSGAIDWKKMNHDAEKLLARVGLAVNPAVKLGSLTVSQQQMVEIARAISHKSKLIIMDEPTSALTPNEIAFLFKVIKNLKAEGVSVLYVSHKLEEVMEICDRVTTYRDGKFVVTRNIADTSMDEIVKDMVGREIDHLFPYTHTATNETVMTVENLSTQEKLKNISFELKKGEVLGVFGLLGAGRTELAKAIFGYDKISSGDIFVNGLRIKPGDTASAVRAGMGLVTEDRKEEGILHEMSVVENMTLPTISEYQKGLVIDTAKERVESKKMVDKFSIKTPSLGHKIMFLSGGNQQKVLLARWMMKNIDVMILDEPTRGIDVGAKSEIHGLIDGLASEGVAVLVMTSEMPEILGVSDRIMVMNNGKITEIIDRKDATQERVLTAAIKDPALEGISEK